jgi:hypothetical protein
MFDCYAHMGRQLKKKSLKSYHMGCTTHYLLRLITLILVIPYSEYLKLLNTESLARYCS